MSAIIPSKSLEKYGEFMLIDNLCRLYPAYKHNDIFELSVSEVYTIKVMSMEMNYYDRQRATMRTKLNKPKKNYKKP